ncbi:hypothetical protein Rhopal_005138-T1 [Rhodotorula paludigena]|uniref:Small nuclear ribonucleoprotein Prp3 C-terminal domain-containing protein n=1 Tax=Rhodotorula paludigena TaxID=86838 RepID=A0AAV5GNR6_9BASI|nr:hypothetical protein Rhopal_005138-T1 [Rhodotorula paludigena]
MPLEALKEELLVLQSSLADEELEWDDDDTRSAWEPVLADAADLTPSLPLPTLSLRLVGDTTLTAEYRRPPESPHFALLCLTLDREEQAGLRRALNEAVEAVGSGGPTGPLQLKTVLLWSHHLLATSKRKDIVAWSTELELYGLSKPGYPGVIIVEGLAHNADEFVCRIKQLQWKALQVRCELDGPVVVPPEDLDAKEAPRWAVRRRSHLGSVLDPDEKGKICVREMEGLNEVGEIMRAAGLEDVFLTALKLNK